MSSDFSSLRSTEDIINALSTLYFNLNEIEHNLFGYEFIGVKIISLRNVDGGGLQCCKSWDRRRKNTR